MVEDGCGQSARRLEDGMLLRGAGSFTADLNLDRQVHMVVLRSPHGHADITAMDSAGAAAMAVAAAGLSEVHGAETELRYTEPAVLAELDSFQHGPRSVLPSLLVCPP